jgi:hypothetical protein
MDIKFGIPNTFRFSVFARLCENACFMDKLFIGTDADADNVARLRDVIDHEC